MVSGNGDGYGDDLVVTVVVVEGQGVRYTPTYLPVSYNLPVVV